MKSIFLLIISLLTYKTIAQTQADQQLGVWYMYGSSNQLSEKWTLKSLAHFRMFDLADDLQQYLFRIGGNYKINSKVSITGGYAYLNTDTTFNNKGGTFNEHRLYEDFLIKHKATKLGFNHRFRLEHRFFDKNTQHWIRYQLGLSYPISSKWSSYIFDEVFINFEGNAYAQNWLGGGFSYAVSELIKLKAGYMNIMLNNTHFDRIQLGVVFTTKSKK